MKIACESVCRANLGKSSLARISKARASVVSVVGTWETEQKALSVSVWRGASKE